MLFTFVHQHANLRRLGGSTPVAALWKLSRRTLATPSGRLPPSYYDHLQITPQASKQDIKKAFYKLSMKYHPDRNHGDSSAHSQFIQINEAYDTLGGELKRREYDRKLQLDQQNVWGRKGGASSGYGFASSPRYHRSTPPKGSNASWMRSSGNPRPGSGTGTNTGPEPAEGEPSDTYQHHWTDGYRPHAASFYTRSARAWDRAHSSTSSTSAFPGGGSGGSHSSRTTSNYRPFSESKDVRMTDFDVNMARASGVFKSVIIWCLVVGAGVYGSEFYVHHLRTEPIGKPSSTTPKSRPL